MPAIDVTAITLAELRYVVALHDERHFGRAAKLVHVTQPTLSAQLAKLERILGVQLFERTSRGVRPTATGVEVARAAREVLDGMAKIVELAGQGREPLSGPLRLAMIPTLGPYLLPHVAPLYARAFPRLELVFRERKTDDQLHDLESGELDLGFLALPIGTPGLAHAAVFEEPFLLATPADHPLAKKKAVREEDLEGERVLLLDEGHCLREQALSVCRKAGAQTNAGGDFRATSLATLRHMVAAGMGLTLLPALAAEAEGRGSARIALRPFRSSTTEGRGPSRRIALCWRRTHPRAADHLRLAATLRASLPAGVRALGD